MVNCGFLDKIAVIRDLNVLESREIRWINIEESDSYGIYSAA